MAFELGFSKSFEDEHKDSTTTDLLIRPALWGLSFHLDNTDVLTFSNGENSAQSYSTILLRYLNCQIAIWLWPRYCRQYKYRVRIAVGLGLRPEHAAGSGSKSESGRSLSVTENCFLLKTARFTP